MCYERARSPKQSGRTTKGTEARSARYEAGATREAAPEATREVAPRDDFRDDSDDGSSNGEEQTKAETDAEADLYTVRE